MSKCDKMRQIVPMRYRWHIERVCILGEHRRKTMEIKDLLRK